MSPGQNLRFTGRVVAGVWAYALGRSCFAQHKVGRRRGGTRKAENNAYGMFDDPLFRTELSLTHSQMMKKDVQLHLRGSES